MRLRASRSAIRSIRQWRVLSPRGRPVGRFRAALAGSGSPGATSRRNAGPAVPRRCRRRSPTTSIWSGCSATPRRSNSCPCCSSPAPTTCCSTSPTASSPSGTRTSRADHRSPDDPGLMPTFARFVARSRGRARRAARHPEDADERGRPLRLVPAGARPARRRDGPARPPRRRRERRAQPPARPVRVPLRRQAGDGAVGTFTSSAVPRTWCSRRPPVAPCRCPPACRRSARGSASTVTRSMSPTPMRRAGSRHASGRTRPTGSIDSAPRSAWPRRAADDARRAMRSTSLAARRSPRSATAAIRW